MISGVYVLCEICGATSKATVPHAAKMIASEGTSEGTSEGRIIGRLVGPMPAAEALRESVKVKSGQVRLTLTWRGGDFPP